MLNFNVDGNVNVTCEQTFSLIVFDCDEAAALGNAGR